MNQHRERIALCVLMVGMVIFDAFHNSKLPGTRRIALREKAKSLVWYDRCLNGESRRRVP